MKRLPRRADGAADRLAGIVAHARAGREAASRIGAAESVIATDVIEAIPAGMLPGSSVE